MYIGRFVVAGFHPAPRTREALEPERGIEPLEIFRLHINGGVEITHNPTLPFATLRTNGPYCGSTAGASLTADSMERLGAYLIRYARRLRREHPFYA